MRDINILIDSNIILDVVQEREPFTSNAKNILSQCITRRINGFVTAHSLCDIFYILRKDKTLAERLSLIGTLCKYVTVLSERQSDFEDIANNPETRDFNFTFEGFINSINGELLGKWGNFVNRTLQFINKSRASGTST